MRQMRESAIEKYVKEYAKKLGWLPFKFVSPSHRGVPDCIFFRKGVTILIEFKALGKKPTALQEVTIKMIRDQNIPVYVIDSKESGVEQFNKLEKAI